MSPRIRDAHLDGVRGLAALMVVFAHLVLAFQPALLGGGEPVAHFAASVWLGHTGLIVLYNPDMAVTVFFVLSGYVLAGSVNARPAPIAALVVRRYVRLALPVLAASVFAWGLVEAGAFHPAEAGALAKSDWLGQHYAWVGRQGGDVLRMLWLALAGSFAFGPYDYDPALWTMPTEFWGSVILFLAYRYLPGTFASREGGLVVAALAIALAWDTRFCGFAYGVALFEIMRRLPPGLGRAGSFAGFALLLAGLGMGGMPYVVDLAADGPYARLLVALAPHLGNPVVLLHQLGAVCLVAAALVWRRLQFVLNSWPCQFLGRISFILYLVHVPVMCALGGLLLAGWAAALGYNAASVVLSAVVLAVSLALATLGTQFIDRPAIRLAGRAGNAVAGWAGCVDRRKARPIRGVAPDATKGLCPLEPRQGQSPWNP